MKKLLLFASVIILLINSAACGRNTQKTENIHSAIHSMYYDMDSYRADCSVTSYTAGGENTYECDIIYNKQNDEFTVESDDMKLCISKDKTKISKGGNSIETPPNENDMHIFVNSFFRSYYESESTALITSGNSKNNTTLLECDVMNPTSAASHMKLWINNKNVLPQKMQVYDKNGVMNTEIDFKKYEFTK